MHAVLPPLLGCVPALLGRRAASGTFERPRAGNWCNFPRREHLKAGHEAALTMLIDALRAGRARGQG